MAKAHKLAQNGLGVDTALTVEELQSICAQVAPLATGNHWKGKHKTTLTYSEGGEQVYEVTNALLKWDVHMTFVVRITEVGARRHLITEIGQYKTLQPTVFIFIPTGPKSMTAHHTYVEFVTVLANTIREADPTAHLSLVTGAFQQVQIPRTTQPTATPPPTPVAPAAATAPTPQPDLAALVTAPHEVEPDNTVAVPRLPKVRVWHLEGEGLEPIEIAGRLLLGRAPEARNTRDRAVAIDTADSTLSATHAAVEVIDGRVIITDLGSTNGTAILTVGHDEFECAAGVATEVPDGATIELGAVAFRARQTSRRPA